MTPLTDVSASFIPAGFFPSSAHSSALSVHLATCAAVMTLSSSSSSYLSFFLSSLRRPPLPRSSEETSCRCWFRERGLGPQRQPKSSPGLRPRQWRQRCSWREDEQEVGDTHAWC
ncbi:hypothetical protein V7S43_013856 [Phytophthora oleae]|uniref:Uncharacterized protein n=1 Tax=Phytophthora oleae TaxID=2107226 RepID=A0ABD3F357_9STRA